MRFSLTTGTVFPTIFPPAPPPLSTKPSLTPTSTPNKQHGHTQHTLPLLHFPRLPSLPLRRRRPSKCIRLSRPGSRLPRHPFRILRNPSRRNSRNHLLRLDVSPIWFRHSTTKLYHRTSHPTTILFPPSNLTNHHIALPCRLRISMYLLFPSAATTPPSLAPERGVSGATRLPASTPADAGG
ncbi:hypothetical protein BDD12DRAFT_829898, partial [Trichophaea hybrida]